MKKEIKEVGRQFLNILGILGLIVMVYFMSYMFNLAKYGSAGIASTNVFGIKVIYPVPGTPDCNVQEMTAELVETKSPGLLGGDSTHYYLKFKMDGTHQRAFEVYQKDVIYFSPDNVYKITVCDGEIVSYEKEN